MPIYTKSGDGGTTGVARNVRVSKSCNTIAALGDLDELNAILGSARLHLTRSHGLHLCQIQNDLFVLGSRIAGFSTPKATKTLLCDRVAFLEVQIDALDKKLPRLTSFILPAGHKASAVLHLARAVCRRCERSLVEFKKHKDLIPYLNRLSDYLFVLARYENYRRRIKDELVKTHHN